MTLDITEIVSIAVQCAECGKHTQKPLAWLILETDLLCPACGAVIDIQSGYNRTVIEKIRNACAEVGNPPAIKR